MICKGFGCPIYISNSFLPEKDFGQLLTHKKYTFEMEFINYNKEDYQLLCTRIKDAKNLKMAPEEQCTLVFQAQVFLFLNTENL